MRGLCFVCYKREQEEKARAKPAKVKKVVDYEAKFKLQLGKDEARRKKAKAARRESFPVKKAKLHTIFSKFIRLRDTDADGYCNCICCGVRTAWPNVQCGHFMIRERMPTTWDEQNCAGQRDGCNMSASGNQYEMGLALDVRYGNGTAEKLVIKSKGLQKFTTAELDEKIAYYTEQVQRLLQKKNFDPWQKKK